MAANGLASDRYYYFFFLYVRFKDSDFWLPTTLRLGIIKYYIKSFLCDSSRNTCPARAAPTCILAAAFLLDSE